MAGDIIERSNYFESQFLGAEDFKAQQDYHRDMRRRHNVGHHTWGIVTGLDLVERPREGDPAAVDVFITPGLAIDGFGREIIVLHEEKLDPALFDSFSTLLHREVWIAFDEELARRPAAGYEVCTQSPQFSRINESYRFVIDPPQPTHDAVLVTGKAASTAPPPGSSTPKIAADESVPYQELPDDEDGPVWLVRLGSANWDGVARKFVPANPDRLIEGRSYVGIVAEQALAPADDLRIKRRTPLADLDSEDFASVEGRLRVDGRIVAKKDVYLHGGKASFQSTTGFDDNHELSIQRIGGGAAAGNDLRITIGSPADDGNSKVRLTVGPAGQPGPPAVPGKDILAVRADDFVDITTGRLNFGVTPRQMINLLAPVGDQAPFGIGVQTSTTYFRSNSEFCWFKGGKHDSGQSIPGDGGTLQLRLDDQARFHFGASVRQMLNLWQERYGIGVQDFTLFFRSDADFCWFRGGAFSPGRSDAGGGAVAMKLDSQGRLGIGTPTPAIALHVEGDLGRPGGPSTLCLFDSRIGDTGGGILFLQSGGDVVAFNGGDNVGIGMTAPAARLHVQNSLSGAASSVASHVAIVENISLGSSADVLALKVGINNPGGNNNFITFFGGTAAVGRIEGDGAGGISLISGGSDFAECLPRSNPAETLQPGDVVGVHEGQISHNTNNAHHAMVVTSRPVLVGNNPASGTEHLYARVAFVGQVDVRVRGLVRAGDVIVPSGDNDGVGVARSREEWRNDPHRSPMVGTAWASSDDNDVKLIRAVVGISTHL